jgi:hypothetical protein
MTAWCLPLLLREDLDEGIQAGLALTEVARRVVTG